MKVSWAIEKYFSLFLRSILAGPIIVIVSWAVENNLVYFGGYSGWSMIVIVFWSYPLVDL